MNKLNYSFKKVSCFFILFFLVSITNAQNNDIKEIEALTLQMFKDTNAKNFEAVVEMTYPKVFEIASKEMITELFKGMFEGNNEYKIELEKGIPAYKISEVFKDEKNAILYAFVSYHMKMTMSFLNKEFDDETKEIMAKMMKMQGMDVNFTSNSSMKVTQKNSLVLFLKDEITNNQWKMLNYNPDSPLFFQILPTSIIEQSKSYHQNLMLESAKQEGK